MKEHPILFSAPMVRAILAGRKTQTRRVVKLREFGPSDTVGYDWTVRDRRALWNDVTSQRLFERYCPCAPGDRLWVRETWLDDELRPPSSAHEMNVDRDEHGRVENVYYRADGDIRIPGPWRPSIFMPRWASRITLEVTAVRAERLQDISEDGARAEGIERQTSIGPARAMGWKDYGGGPGWLSPIGSFASLWQSLNGRRPGCGWDANPWVWVYEFCKIPHA